MFTLTSRHRAIVAMEQERLTDAVLAYALAAAFTQRTHEREIAFMRGEAIGLRNEIAALKRPSPRLQARPRQVRSGHRRAAHPAMGAGLAEGDGEGGLMIPQEVYALAQALAELYGKLPGFNMAGDPFGAQRECIRDAWKLHETLGRLGWTLVDRSTV